MVSDAGVFVTSTGEAPQILELGGWKSAAVLRYLAIKEIDQMTTLNNALDDSSSDDG